MSVRLATQVFSRSTAVGIKLYREAKVPGIENSEGTETFTRMVNDLFDALNIKLPLRGVRRHSKEIQPEEVGHELIKEEVAEKLTVPPKNQAKERSTDMEKVEMPAMLTQEATTERKQESRRLKEEEKASPASQY
ncbi:hypothetical protein HPB51_024390 [Rhipicephalus microplus]|uniref:Transposable element P transposase-like GTP-binding insertion domain-containing protein n=1 Tax=Rhipicephalus microplus TaxID=6941 RepID=A0A9J6D7K7_RHIMP|nr:hypothetical protein HPB51_024390 [Rhipicephalus microplus]